MWNKDTRTLDQLALSMNWDRERTRFERLSGGLAHETYVAHVDDERYVVKFLYDGFVKYGIHRAITVGTPCPYLHQVVVT